MSRWERVNCASLVAILATLLLLAGSYLPSAHGSAQQPITSDAVSAPVTTPADDEVATDSESEPSGIDGMTVGELLRDAWSAQQAVVTGDRSMPEPLVATDEYVASYEGDAPAFPADYYRVNSAEHENVVHVFRVVVAYKA